MKIRAKLWLLLLATGLAPMSLLALFFLHGTHELGSELTDHASEALRDRELAYLEAKVAGNVALLGNHFDLLRQAVSDQAWGVEAALAAAAPEDVAFVMASDFDSGRAATSRDPLYQRLGPGGESTPVDVSLERVAMHLGPGAQRAERAADMTRLAMLLPTYARLHDIPSARTIWHYTSLEDGVHSVWPAHGGYPEAYDPRQRSWYREAMAADGPVISLPLVDVSTRRVVTSVSQKVRGPGGDVVGVTGIDVSVPGIFDSIASDPRQWSEHGEEMIAQGGPLRSRADTRVHRDDPRGTGRARGLNRRSVHSPRGWRSAPWRPIPARPSPRASRADPGRSTGPPGFLPCAFRRRGSSPATRRAAIPARRRGPRGPAGSDTAARRLRLHLRSR